ncbi:alpha/beta hydrolase [Rubrobacter marinus]|uniref:Alpha/beta hydrolase n=1 Tax=Rubrobacter marinus TaxID=2653852 RepID=A0A6G8PVI0_9ACTN|nr:alpha/beta hydrolase [Rubrobacter marinus]QIN78177.1 alpha/beta hydrolase [Rubrobacter marinus]
MRSSIYRTAEGAVRIEALYGEALAALGVGHESRRVGTRSGETHVLVAGPEDAPPAVFLPGGNFLNPTCLRWFLPLARHHRLYAPDIVGQPGRSAQERPSPLGDGHAFWLEDVMDGLGLERAPLVGLSYGAGIAIRTMGAVPERISRAALVSPAGLVRGPVPPMLARVVVPMLLYRLRPTDERLRRATAPLLTEPDGLAVRQLGAVYRHVRLDAALPRLATEEELEGFGGPVAVFASENDLFFPAPAVLARAREVFPNLAHSECLAGCRHVPSRAALESVCDRIRVLLGSAP